MARYRSPMPLSQNGGCRRIDKSISFKHKQRIPLCLRSSEIEHQRLFRVLQLEEDANMEYILIRGHIIRILQL
ncbi:hypothetical protein L2E82_28088 [Cichorium intybus]|uniref:Uncharacterized protein n=1 Tax=Cichorium intybus TaxID=13427 RepID=A0ACB9CUX9_CICIN|nr:hypothetical protein L2E82_28088 [Cichorium intybus]